MGYVFRPATCNPNLPNMLTKIWRYSHFSLTFISSIFLLLATLTGLILAFEPIQRQCQPFQIPDAKKLPLAQVLDTLAGQYDEVLEIEVDANYFIKAVVISMEEALDGEFYINPFNGKKIADIPPKSTFFEWMTNFHRSLFLKSTGRFLIGVTSFFLFLIALTGTLLLIKRQGGLRPLFGKIVKDDFYQYFHIILGRWTLVPIVIISLTGVNLSLLRFEMIPTGEPAVVESPTEKTANPKEAPLEFDVFKTTKLGDIRKLEFPFTEDVDDYFILSLKDSQLKINQQTGQVVETKKYPVVQAISSLSFNLHTGTGSILWSLVLAVASINILFFMYSGTMIAYRRLRSSIRNPFRPDEAEYVILVGSENGSTKKFGKLLQQALLQLNKKVFLDELNNYRLYQRMNNLVVLTSTYGEGDPPSNATKFLQKFQQTPPRQATKYSVVGFGSLAYPNFCEFAIEVDKALELNTNLSKVTKPHLIHNQSESGFKTWVEAWSQLEGLRLKLPSTQATQKTKQFNFLVADKKMVNDGYGETFTLRLTTKHKPFKSGDLLGIIPPNDTVVRWYSIAKIEKNNILLSIKRHKSGLCSNYLFHLPVGTSIQGTVRKNKAFHFPQKAKEVILIGNGTGIAPYLGMIQKEYPKTHISLYWGGRTSKSYQLYKSLIDQARATGTLNQCIIAYSREASNFDYVQDIVQNERKNLVRKLNEGATIMICGAIAMQNDVLTILEQTTFEVYQQKLNVYQQKGQILMDCY